MIVTLSCNRLLGQSIVKSVKKSSIVKNPRTNKTVISIGQVQKLIPALSNRNNFKIRSTLSKSAVLHKFRIELIETSTQII